MDYVGDLIMPNFIKCGRTEACQQYGETYTLHTFFYTSKI